MTSGHPGSALCILSLMVLATGSISTSSAAPTYSVVVPFKDVPEDRFSPALTSVKVSMDQFEPLGEVILVDDHSSEYGHRVMRRVVGSVFGGTRHESEVVIIQGEFGGAAAARNRGVTAARSDVVLFADADDYFLAQHVAYCVQALNAHPGIGYARTMVKMDHGVHDDWKIRVSNTLLLAACVRPAAHHFIGGLNETDFITNEYEDGFYEVNMNAFFHSVMIPEETVEYMLYPGNHFDKQLEKFRRAVGDQPPMNQTKLEERLNIERHVAMAMHATVLSRYVEEAQITHVGQMSLRDLKERSEAICTVCRQLMLIDALNEAYTCIYDVIRMSPSTWCAWTNLGELLHGQSASLSEKKQLDVNPESTGDWFSVIQTAAILDATAGHAISAYGLSLLIRYRGLEGMVQHAISAVNMGYQRSPDERAVQTACEDVASLGIRVC